MTRGKKSSSPVGENNWVACDICDNWILYDNTGLKGKFENHNPKVAFSCRQCLLEEKFLSQATEFSLLRKQLTDESIQSLENSKSYAEAAKDIKDINLKLEEKSNRSSEDILSSAQIRQATDELLDINARKLNLIISGLPENGTDIEDFIDYANYFHHLGRNLSVVDFVTYERLG